MFRHNGGEMGGGEALRRDRETGEMPAEVEVMDTPNQQEHGIESGPLGDIMNEIDRAPENGIVFLRGITAKHDPVSANTPFESRAGAKNYVGSLQKAYAGRDDLLVLGAAELGDVGAHGEHAESVIKRIANDPEYAGKKIVLDLEPRLNDILFTPWAALGDTMSEAMNTKGGAAEQWLATWMAEQDTQEEGAATNGPMVSDVERAFASTLESLKGFRNSHLNRRPFSMGFDADSPMALAFLVYCARGRLTPADLEATLPSARKEKGRVGFAHFNGDSVTVSIGHRSPLSRKLG